MTCQIQRSDRDERLSLPAKLRADCTSCHALCCVEPAFLAVQGFRFDKPSQVPCRMLRADDRCSIHSRLLDQGFPACVSYDCYGAGQRTVELFKGASWRTSAGLAQRIFKVFRQLRSLHELMAMLLIGAKCASDENERDSLRVSLRAIEGMCSGSADQIEGIDLARLRKDVLRAVRAAVSPDAMQA